MGCGVSQTLQPPSPLLCTYRTSENSHFIPRLHIYVDGTSPLPPELLRAPPPHHAPNCKADVFDWETSGDIDSSAVLAPAHLLQRSMKDVVEFLCEGLRDTVDKVRVLYCWLTTHNLNQVTQCQINPSAADNYFWRIKKGTENYAHVFSTMCRFARIPCVIIDGFVKGSAYKVGNTVRGGASNSQWNAVLIDDHWYFIDAFWGSCGVSDECYDDVVDVHEFLYECDDNYFLTDPEQLIATHFPRNPKWQLLRESITLSHFEEMAFVKNRFFGLGMSLISHDACVITTLDGEVDIKLGILGDISEQLRFRHLLYDDTCDENWEKYALTLKIKPDVLNIKVKLPCVGVYQLEIIGKDATVADDRYDYDWIVLYKIISKGEVDNCQPWPTLPEIGWGPSFDVRKQGMKPISHESGIIQMDMGKGQIVFNITNQFEVQFSHKLILNGVDVEYFDHVIHWIFDGKLTFYIRLPTSGTFALYLFADKTNFCNYLIESKQAIEHSAFPRDFGAGAGPTRAVKEMNIIPLTHPCPVISTHRNELDVEFEMSTPIELMAVLTGRDISTFDNKKLVEQRSDDSSVMFRIHLPQHGYYRLRIVAVDSGSKEIFKNVYDYLVKYKKRHRHSKTDTNELQDECLQRIGSDWMSNTSHSNVTQGLDEDTDDGDCDLISIKSQELEINDINETDENTIDEDGHFIEITDQRLDGVKSRLGTAWEVDEKDEQDEPSVDESKVIKAKISARHAIVSGDDKRLMREIHRMKSMNLASLKNDIEICENELVRLQCLREIDVAMDEKDVEHLENAIQNLIRRGQGERLRKEMLKAQLMIERVESVEKRKRLVGELSKNDLVEIKSLSKPPQDVKRVVCASMMLLGHPADKGEEALSWRHAVSILAKVDLLKQIQMLDVGMIPMETCRSVKAILEDIGGASEMKKKSMAAAGFYKWAEKVIAEVEDQQWTIKE